MKITIIGLISFIIFSQICLADYCIDNETIARNSTLCINSDCYIINNTEPCPFGCDNKTNVCNPPEWQQSVLNMVIIIIVVIGMISIYRFRRSRT